MKIRENKGQRNIAGPAVPATDLEAPKKEAAPPEYIPNPLPLPKKHVKKKMDYAFEPPQELMRYDLNNYDVDDDYDLKGL